MDRSNRFLILFAKDPRPGRVKTRLEPLITRRGSALLGDAFLQDSLERFAKVGQTRRILAYDPLESIGRLKERVPLAGQWECRGQPRGVLGARLWGMARWSFMEGSRATLLLGTDSPTLPVERVRAAFRVLERFPVVVGPSLDGGYYLLGLSRPLKHIFEGIPWSTHKVLEATLGRLRRKRIPYKMLRPWYDVDGPESLYLLREHLLKLERRSAALIPRRTASFVRRKVL